MRIEGCIEVDMARFTSGTHQQDHQKFYNETQNMCGYRWWTHCTQVVKQYQVCLLTILRSDLKKSFLLLLLPYMSLNHQKTEGSLTKSEITSVLLALLG